MSGPCLTDVVPVVVKEALESDGSELRCQVERAVEGALPLPAIGPPPSSIAAYHCTDFQVGHKIFINEVSLKVDALPQTTNTQQESKDSICLKKGINKKKVLVSGVLLLAIATAVSISIFVDFHPSETIENNEDWPTNGTIELIKRDMWGAIESGAEKKRLKTLPAKYVIVGHTVTSECCSVAGCSAIVRNIQADEIALGMDDIGFNFLVGGEGNVYTGRGWDVCGAHTPLFNGDSLGVALIGDFTDILPPQLQINATLQLLDIALQLGKVSKDFRLFGMYQVSASPSPGKPLADAIKTWPHWSPFTIYDT